MASARPSALLRRPALLLLLATLVPTGAYVTFDTLSLASHSPLVALIAIALVSAAALAVLWFVRKFGPPLPAPAVVAAVAWGAFAAPAFVRPANDAWASVVRAVVAGAEGGALDFAAIAGPVEEAYKLLGIALIGFCWPGSLAGARRGLALGILVGIGFAVLEDSRLLIVVAGSVADPLSAVRSVVEGYGFRMAAAGLFVHAGFTALSGMALGVAYARAGLSRWLLAVAGYLTAAGAHALFNSELVDAPPRAWQEADLPLLLGHAALRNALPIFALAALLVLSRRER